jgi:hypothetical protein
MEHIIEKIKDANPDAAAAMRKIMEEGLADTVDEGKDQVIGNVADVMSASSDVIAESDMPSNMETLMGDLVDIVENTDLGGAMTDALTAMSDALYDAAYDVESAMADMLDAAVDIIYDYEYEFYDGGVSLAEQLADGFYDYAYLLAQAVEDAVEDADAYLPHSPAEKGPFQYVVESGESIPKMLAEGIGNTKHYLEEAMEDSANAIDAINQVAQTDNNISDKNYNNTTNINAPNGTTPVNQEINIQITIQGNADKQVTDEMIDKIARALGYYDRAW